MKVSELFERIKSLAGDDDVNIYLHTDKGITPSFNFYLDDDGDLEIIED